MDGKKLTREVLDFLDEAAPSDIQANQRRIYECLDMAVAIFCRETRMLHASVDITTAEDKQAYDLPSDFIDLYMKNSNGRFFVKFYDGSTYSWPLKTTYEKLFKTNLTDNKDIPGRFAIIDKADKESLIEGTAFKNGAKSGGECVLEVEEDGLLFTSTNRVYPRDIIHNTTDKSTGYVLSVTSATKLVAALFQGTNNDWTVSDAFIIQPAAEKQLVLDAPSGTAAYIITVPYVCMPSPVFSDYAFWRLSSRVCKAIAAGAASIFKIPKGELKDAAVIGGIFAEEINRSRIERAQARLQGGRYRGRY